MAGKNNNKRNNIKTNTSTSAKTSTGAVKPNRVKRNKKQDSPANDGKKINSMGKAEAQSTNVSKELKSTRSNKVNLISRGKNIEKTNKLTYNAHEIENAMHISDAMFDVINNYRGTLKYANAVIQGQAGSPDKESRKTEKIIYNTVTTASLFNPFYAVNSANITQGVPLLDTSKHQDHLSALKEGKQGGTLNGKIRLNTPFDDCSISNLVKLSKLQHSPLGNALYKYSDFMFCRDVGRISNNYMITLRRFATPVADDIFYPTSLRDEASNKETAGDVGRLITWFNTAENKLEDILKYKYKATWKQLEAKIQEKQSEETNKSRGMLGGIVNLFNPAYTKAVGQGRAPSALNLILGDDASDAFYTNAPYADNPVVNGAMYDKNRVYEPKDTIRSTHTYEGKLEFTHEFTLKFPFKLRGYDNINAKSAFLDLLGNILVVTYKQGTFWPGEQRIIGAPQNKAGWNKANAFMNKGIDAAGTFFSKILNGESAGDAFKDLVGSIGQAVGDLFGMGGSFNFTSNEAKDKLKKLATGTLEAIGSEMKGLIKNQMGRPAVYAFDSLLSDDVVGTWHVTIGNPLNPIAVIGNLIITDAEITHTGPLGLDDFPTEIMLTVTLKHAKPRDSVDIQRMYALGRKTIYSKISDPRNIKLNGENSKSTSYEDLKAEIKAEEETAKKIDAELKANDAAQKPTTVEVKEISVFNELENVASKEVYSWTGDVENYRFLVKAKSLK